MLRCLYIACLGFLLLGPTLLAAQDDVSLDPNQVPLGDLAREMRGAKPPEPSEVIDNDNLERVMDKAESERLDSQPVFAISHTGVFTAVSPDGSCSLTFDARSARPLAAAYIASDLPQNELVKIQGPAAIQEDELEISVHNGTPWELKEIAVVLGVLPAPSGPPEYRFATLESAPVVSAEKLPDSGTVYHLKGSAPADATSIFRGTLDGSTRNALGQNNDWHWSIVGARGIPPAAPASVPQSLAAAGNSLTVPGISDPAANSNSGAIPTASNPAPMKDDR
jgi:hypothetical protein